MIRRNIVRTATASTRALCPLSSATYTSIRSHRRPIRCLRYASVQHRPFSAIHPRRSTEGKSAVDTAMEELNELYSTARDEFEIAAEETEANTVYAADDREAARDALTKLQEAYKVATGEETDPGMSEEVKKRVGPRIRELENAVAGVEEMAMNQD